GLHGLGEAGRAQLDDDVTARGGERTRHPLRGGAVGLRLVAGERHRPLLGRRVGPAGRLLFPIALVVARERLRALSQQVDDREDHDDEGTHSEREPESAQEFAAALGLALGFPALGPLLLALASSVGHGATRLTVPVWSPV